MAAVRFCVPMTVKVSDVASDAEETLSLINRRYPLSLSHWLFDPVLLVRGLEFVVVSMSEEAAIFRLELSMDVPMRCPPLICKYCVVTSSVLSSSSLTFQDVRYDERLGGV